MHAQKEILRNTYKNKVIMLYMQPQIQNLSLLGFLFDYKYYSKYF